VRTHITICAILALALIPPVWAQSPDEPETPSSVPVLPTTVTGDGLPPEAVQEGERSREWAGLVEVGAACDDNAFSTQKNTVSDCTYSVRPRFSLRNVDSRSSWNLTYGPGLLIDQKYSWFSESEHSIGMDMRYRVTQRLTLRVRELLEKTTTLNGLYGAATNPDLPRFGLLQQPNGAVVLPLARQLASTTGLETTYQLSARSFAGVSTTYSDLQYRNLNMTSTVLPRTQTGVASAFYGRLIGRRSWVGVNYNFEHLRWGGIEWGTAHSLLYTYTVVVTPHLSISGFSGPAYWRDHSHMMAANLPPGAHSLAYLQDAWGISAGGTVAWASAHNRLEASFARRVSDGAGYVGPASVNGGAFAFERHLTNKILALFTVSGGETSALLRASGFNLSASSGFQAVLVNTGFTYHLRENVFVGAVYDRDWQDMAPYTSQTSRNRVTMFVRIGFTRPLGR
jgi:hypothetical protein